jgi:translation initiation factor IF-2
MSDSDDKKTLGIRGGSGKASNVRQSFGHGRTKSVVVETKRKRVVIPTAVPQKTTTGSSNTSPPPGLSKRPSGITDAEMTRRLNALKAAKEQEGVDS